jgi:hypothetical protein
VIVDGVDVVLVDTMAAVKWFFFALQKCRISVSTSKLFVDDKVSLAIYNMKDLVIHHHSISVFRLSACPFSLPVFVVQTDLCVYVQKSPPRISIAVTLPVLRFRKADDTNVSSRYCNVHFKKHGFVT